MRQPFQPDKCRAVTVIQRLYNNAFQSNAWKHMQMQDTPPTWTKNCRGHLSMFQTEKNAEAFLWARFNSSANVDVALTTSTSNSVKLLVSESQYILLRHCLKRNRSNYSVSKNSIPLRMLHGWPYLICDAEGTKRVSRQWMCSLRFILDAHSWDVSQTVRISLCWVLLRHVLVPMHVYLPLVLLTWVLVLMYVFSLFLMREDSMCRSRLECAPRVTAMGVGADARAFFCDLLFMHAMDHVAANQNWDRMTNVAAVGTGGDACAFLCFISDVCTLRRVEAKQNWVLPICSYNGCRCRCTCSIYF